MNKEKTMIRYETPFENWKWIADYCSKCKNYKVKWYRPLSLKIYSQLRGIISPKVMASGTIYEALKYHTRSVRYLKSLVEGAPRRNLWGKIDGEVTQREAELARKDLAKYHAGYLRDRRKARRAKIVKSTPKK